MITDELPTVQRDRTPEQQAADLLQSVPASMQEKGQWVRWRIEPRKKGEKPTKMPYMPRADRRAKANDPRTWGSFDDATKFISRGNMQGVGYMFARGGGEVGIDLDGCRDPQTGEIAEWAVPYLEQFCGTYAEVSPSGTGVKVFARGRLPTSSTGRKESFPGREHCGIEAYQNGRFFATTGEKLDGHPSEVTECQSAIDAVWEKIDELREAKKPKSKSSAANPSNSLDVEPQTESTASSCPLGEVGTPLMRRCWAYMQKMPDAISGQGGHDATFAAACICHRFALEWDGSATDEAMIVMQRFNAEKTGGERWSDDELRHKLDDAKRAVEEAGQVGDLADAMSILQAEHRTDIANGKRLVKRHGEDLRYIGAWDSWSVYDGQRWQDDSTAQVDARAKDIPAALWLEVKSAEQLLDAEEDAALIAAIKSYARSSSSATGLRNMISMAKSELGMSIDHESLDTDPWLLNVANGTIDLRIGKLRPYSRNDYLSKLCPVEFHADAGCPLWRRFLADITCNDSGLQSFIQRLVGYSLTGSTRDHVLPFLHGQGANGKSVLTSIIIELLGSDYAMRAAPELLMVKSNESHPTERADLFRKRLVIGNEIEAGKRLNESLVKDLTGGDRVRARRMREDFWEFDPTHKIWLVGNHKPIIRGTDNGIWRRIKMIPFNRIFAPAEQDRELPAKLLRELPGILNWAIRGCLDWQTHGLGEPPAVTAATAEYRESQDAVGQFIADRCIVAENVRVKASHLYESYGKWAESTGERPLGNRTFYEEIARRFEKRSSNGMWYIGIGLAETMEGWKSGD